MTKLDSAEIPISKRPPFAAQAPIMISQDDARQGPMGHQVLYVLGFGIVGAIFANALVFIYFAWLYASGWLTTLRRARNGGALSSLLTELMSIASMNDIHLGSICCERAWE
jgi:hypothetical protein